MLRENDSERTSQCVIPKEGEMCVFSRNRAQLPWHSKLGTRAVTERKCSILLYGLLLLLFTLLLLLDGFWNFQGLSLQRSSF